MRATDHVRYRLTEVFIDFVYGARSLAEMKKDLADKISELKNRDP